MLFALTAHRADPTGVIVLLLIAAVVAGVSAAQRWKRRALFRVCAEGLGGQLVRADADTFVATVRGLELVVELHAASKNFPARTFVKVKAAAPFALVLYLRPETMDEEAAVEKGEAVDVVIGDPALDAAWIVEGAPPARVVRMLADPALRDKLRAFAAVSEPRAAVEDDHVLVSCRGLDIDGGAVATPRIELALALAEAAVAESARPRAPDEGGATRPDGRGELAQIAAVRLLGAQKEIVLARAMLVLTELTLAAMTLMVAATVKKPLPALAPAVWLGVNVYLLRTLLAGYLRLRKRVPRGVGDTLTLAVVGLANAILVYQVVSALLR